VMKIILFYLPRFANFEILFFILLIHVIQFHLCKRHARILNHVSVPRFCNFRYVDVEFSFVNSL